MSNPFADTHSRPQALDDNPFADTSDPVNPFSNPSNNASAFSLESQTTPVPGGRGAGGFQAQQDDAGYRAREEELRRRDEEVQRRQRELDERERRLDAGEGKANWPFFFPMIRHEIRDLPLSHQSTMKQLYIQWLGLLVTLIINLVACILLLIAGSSDGGKDTAAAGSYTFVITVTSFFLWYRPIYLGYKKEGGLALFFYMYFFFGGWHLLFSLYMLIGIPSTGSAGLINTISMLSQSHVLSGVFGVITSVGWAVQTVFGGWLYKRVWDFKNNNEGISFQNATNQFKAESFKTVVLHQSRI